MPNSVLYSLPIGTIWWFSKRLISPALETLKFQATLSFELIVPSPVGTQPLLETRTVRSSHFDQLGSLLSNGPPSHPLRPSFRLSLCQNQLPEAFSSSLSQCILSSHQKHSTRPCTFFSDLFLNSPDTFILGDFNAHYPTWDTHISPDSAGNSLFNWISSSQLNILNDPDMHTLLHFSGSRSSSDVSLGPSHLAPSCEWRTLPGLEFDHFTIGINLQLAPICPTKLEPQPSISNPPPPIKETQDIHCVARSFLLLLNAAKASIPFRRLGRPPKAWWFVQADLAMRDSMEGMLRGSSLCIC